MAQATRNHARSEVLCFRRCGTCADDLEATEDMDWKDMDSDTEQTQDENEMEMPDERDLRSGKQKRCFLQKGLSGAHERVETRC